MSILQFVIIIQIIYIVFASQITNLEYCEIQEKFCGARRHILCAQPTNTLRGENSLLTENFSKSQLMNIFNSHRNRKSQITWDIELEVMSTRFSPADNPKACCMSSRKFVDIRSTIIRMYVFENNGTHFIPENTIGNDDGIIRIMGCSKSGDSRIDGGTKYIFICLYNFSDRLTSDEYQKLHTDYNSLTLDSRTVNLILATITFITSLILFFIVFSLYIEVIALSNRFNYR